MIKPLKIKLPPNKIWFTGCNHYGHTPKWSPALYQSRGFSSIQDHDLWLLKEYQKLSQDSVIFILGDFSLNTDEIYVEKLFNQIPCKKFYIEGNHESQVSKYYRKLIKNEFGREDIDVYPFTDTNNNLTFLGSYSEVFINNQHCILSHFPFSIWNQSHKSSWNLHSHNHGSFKESLPDYPYFKRLDVGVDVFKGLVSFEEIQKIMFKKEIKQLDHHNQFTN
jgi:calcineurin-like phosphoesterase family protein